MEKLFYFIYDSRSKYNSVWLALILQLLFFMDTFSIKISSHTVLKSIPLSILLNDNICKYVKLHNTMLVINYCYNM